VFQGLSFGDGMTPVGGVILDSAGNLYGTTGYGGTGHCLLLGGDVGCGTVYELTPPAQQGGAWTETVIYSFQGGKDGYVPTGNLVFDGAGNLYGATYYGGGFGVCDQGIYANCGTIFELRPPKTKGGPWTEKVLYSFKSGRDGADPNGSLAFDSKGALYGTTFFGGNLGCAQAGGVGCGTVFKLTPPAKKGPAWKYEMLHRFDYGSSRQAQEDGENPAAGVILDKNDTVYGTTERGGGARGEGTVFALTPPTKRNWPWTETTLYVFGYHSGDGWNPLGLVFGPAGSLCGVANRAGANGSGTIFRLNPPMKQRKHWGFTSLYSFLPPPDGVFPTDYLILDKNGSLFGVTQQGGSEQCQQGGCGTVFEFTP
jgi:uncharacterized protein YceK